MGSVWGAAVPTGFVPPAQPAARRSRDKRLLAAAVLGLLLLLGGGLTVATSRSGSASQPVVAAAPVPAPHTTVSATIAVPAAAPQVSPVRATFVEAQRATFYAVAVVAQGTVSYAWHLTPPKGNAGCNRFAPVPGSPNKAVWHHADTDGCAHTGFQHNGTVSVTVTTKDWKCTATFFGTLTKSGPPAQRCTRA